VPTVGEVSRGKAGHMSRGILTAVCPESSNFARKSIGPHF
jgi:hypothetical protein